MITRWSEGLADDNMAEDILVDLGEVIARHPWWRARAALTMDLLRRLGVRPPARVLDAGCGWGTTLEALEARGYRAAGADISRRALEKLDRPGRELIEADLTRPLPPGLPPYDAALLLDVIEHIEDDREALARAGSLVKPGGVLIASVPAQPGLFTEFDAIQGHRRRYLPETLRGAFQGTGLDLERTFWWGAWMVPVLRWQRKAKRAAPGESPAETYRRYLKLPPWPGPLALRLAYALEHRRALAGKLRTGTSLFAVARRPA
ncbi:bifunctional 3-demethylubiquinone-9 3-methyltransferase/ 2-octaprenyl-6-hydroxy phenol methylase [Aquisphaera giovannonii]|uniref:Bifunctional 3-demethylubiquinone-9 3-methyltransferase/ 2-octaprenyl-6-hydroxy phenol methylase n=1 Tax=Aquisphaera giovannonii TaxID=406548 RepID=A0A5B9WE95_9BACT|nr:class I SAM-dependent methyltransferase [Aquisphaera giovannonii]QEH38291.1 bifunctional 3-demethylubiquinone-9 3-methyltransferase/ 2-octaprenyl-6-hydroxy phenol methylase [Aquisphaera giovannonii]